MLKSEIQAGLAMALACPAPPAWRTGGTTMVPRAPIRDFNRQAARTLWQCPGPPRARGPPVRTFCDLTKRHFMMPIPARTGGEVQLTERAWEG